MAFKPIFLNLFRSFDEIGKDDMEDESVKSDPQSTKEVGGIILNYYFFIYFFLFTEVCISPTNSRSFVMKYLENCTYS